MGLPTSTLLATSRYQVYEVDVRPKVLATISQGNIHNITAALAVLVRSAIYSDQLAAATEPATADVFLIAELTLLKAKLQRVEGSLMLRSVNGLVS